MFKAFWRLISSLWRRGSRRANDAADAVYTSSAQGISDAFDEAQENHEFIDIENMEKYLDSLES
jgi:hypothetical protein